MSKIVTVSCLIVIFFSCTSLRTTPSGTQVEMQAIKLAIEDFIKSNKHGNDDTVFYVYTKLLPNEILGVNISSTYDNVLVSTEDREKYTYQGLPTGYIEKEGNLFYWHDSLEEHQPDMSSIPTLKKYNLLDTMVVNEYMPPSTLSDDQKVTDYYFCKSNVASLKKVRTTKAMGNYTVPKHRCN